MWPFGKSTEKRLEEALAAYEPLRGAAYDVRVDGKTVVVSGEVPTIRHKRLIEGVARGLNGVDHVDTGSLRIASGAPEAGAGADTEPEADPGAVANALRSHPALADDPIDVWVDGNVVKLRGAVDSQSELDAALAAARGATRARVDGDGLRIVENVKVLASTNEQGDVVYEVKPGDTLSAIALKYYGSAGRKAYMRIAEHNDIENPDLIRVGQKLVIPGSPDGPDTQLG